MADLSEAAPGLTAHGLAGALSALPDPVVILSAVRGADGVIVDLRHEFLNESAARLYGLSVEAVLHRRLCELFPSVRELGIFDDYVQVVESGTSASFEARQVLESGSKGSFWRTAVRFGDGILVSGHDITGQRRAESALAEISRRYQLLAENASDFVVQTTPEGVLTWVSPSVTAVLGWVPRELVGRNWFDLIEPELTAAIRAAVARAAAGESVFGRAQLRCADGSYRWVSRTWRPIADDSGAVIALVAGFRDIQAEVESERALATSEEQYRLLAENASDVAMLLSLSRTFEWVSDPVTEILGWLPADLVGQMIDKFIHPDDVARFRQVVADAPGGAASIEFRFRCADGTFQWVACRTRAKLDPDGTPVAVVGAMVDITSRKAAEAELTFSASHDPLTGLANRAMLVDEADRALAAGQRSGRTTALLMVDLDHFKTVNDALGHSVGDELLRAVARRIAGSVRSVDLVARHGGDEFVVLLRDLDDPTHALRLAERLVVEAREPVTVGGTDLYATTSVGIASAVPGVDPVRGAVDLIREADTAMYAAKLAGRDRAAQFTDDLRRVVDDRLHLEGDLRHALAREELAVWYQPEISLRDGTVRAAEALLRWHHPDGQLREAAQFIDVAQDSGLILDIGAWVLGQACADAARWATGEPPRQLVLRINLSPPELGQPDLLTTLDQALSASGLNPRLLCVEITETTMLSDSSTVKANLAGIAARGIELAIDDFGTGHGSLTYLRRYPIDVLKIARSFVTHITTDTSDRNLVAGMVALADRLGISVTAEGIETSDQERVLDSIGCAGAQGYLYSPALPIDEWTEFIQGHRAAEQT